MSTNTALQGRHRKGRNVSATVSDLAGLPERLRRETAACHAEVEAIADISRAIRSRDDYVEFLLRLHGLHAGLEGLLMRPAWAQGWIDIGVRISAHCRADLLAADLGDLGRTAPAHAPPELPRFATFSHALGCLYVLEGSALGGRIVAEMVHDAIGDVPATFLTGHGRRHPAPWQEVRSALRNFDAQDGDCDGVVAGALTTFAEFGRQLSRTPVPTATSPA